jgi:hypothetical protein
MTDTALRNRLLATVPALDDADWLDVRRRARAIEAPRRRNRRLFAIAAVLVLLTALVVNPALGIGERLLDFVEGDPAPERVRKAFLAHEPTELRVGHRVFTRPKAPPPNLADAHLAVALDSSVGPVYLWVADGGACMLLEIEAVPDLPDGRPTAGGGCGSVPTAERPIDAGAGATRVDEAYFNYIRGRVRSNISRLEATLSDGREVELRLVEGFFLAELPASTLAEKVAGCEAPPEPPLLTRAREQTRDPASTPCFVGAVEYRGFDTNGRLVERFRVPTLPPSSTPTSPFREAISIRLFSGREARIEYARAEGNQLCWRVRWGQQTSGSCGPVDERRLPVGLMFSGGGKKQTVLLQGPVGSDIKRVDLVWDDGTTERLPIGSGFVLKQIDRYGKRWPSTLVGRGESGQVIAEDEVNP